MIKVINQYIERRSWFVRVVLLLLLLSSPYFFAACFFHTLTTLLIAIVCFTVERNLFFNDSALTSLIISWMLVWSPLADMATVLD